MLMQLAVLLVRPGVVVALAPTFGGLYASGTIKVGLTALLALGLLPAVVIPPAIDASELAGFIAREMAIGMAPEGGIGIVHTNMSIENQALHVERVKRAEHGGIVDPVTLPPEATVRDAIRIMDERNIGGVPISQNG